MSAHLIHILPPQLANQIAAGEVVERPASVVKELVENSLDAGANQIQIDIEKGGAQLIRIRDNGCGIGKADLPLALARHATSKIASLEDLEAILSLGFRGEALASISSVSRLTLTSRTADQTEAWQAYAQGREMAVEIQPASHPVGTTIEVANLFFNTPARRKFLRTDKTEFAHIDEVVRRIALAKPNITFILTHNDKKIRHYKAVADQSVAQQQKRVAAICGEEFILHSNHIDWQHGELHLHGWVGSPRLARTQNDLCYSYVNGRMMRDKTLNHAIRQAYGDRLARDHYPAFVLFLDLNPSLVDVNVHPAKHEVRFHQGRLVHDFLYQGVLNALEGQADFVHGLNEPSAHYIANTNRAAAGQNSFAEPQPSQQAVQMEANFAKSASYTPNDFPKAATPSRSAQKAYGELLQTHSHERGEKREILQNSPDLAPLAPVVKTAEGGEKSVKISPPVAPVEVAELAQAVAIVQNQALLLKQKGEFWLISLAKLAQQQFQLRLNQGDSQALLIPLNLPLDATQQAQWQEKEEALRAFGFVCQLKKLPNQARLTLLQVPSCLREQNLQQLMLGALQAADLNAFFANFAPSATACSLAEAVAMLAEVEQQGASKTLEALKVRVDFTPFLAQC